MSKKPGQLESSALAAWTPAQQAALYHLHTLRQKELDEAAALKSDKEKEDKRARGIVEEEVKPETVRAGVLVDDLVGFLASIYICIYIFSVKLMS